MELKTLKVLDDVLEIIIVAGIDVPLETINLKYKEKYPNNISSIHDVLEKLQDDDYIKNRRVYDEGFEGVEDYYSHTAYTVRFEGRVFLEQGGYQGKVKKLNSEIELNKTIQYLLSGVGSISGIYYISECLKTTLGIVSIELALFFLLSLLFYFQLVEKKTIPTTLLVIGLLTSFILSAVSLIRLLGMHL